MIHNDYFDGEIRIRKSKRSDISYLKDNLRDEDLLEIKLMGNESIEKSLLAGYETPESLCYTLEFHDKIVLMFGCAPVPDKDSAASLWMLATNDVRKFRKKFLKLTKMYVEGFKDHYDLLFNLVHPSNKLSLKLVTMLKAELRAGYVSPATGEKFILFLI